jgi:hypothetical protein
MITATAVLVMCSSVHTVFAATNSLVPPQLLTPTDKAVVKGLNFKQLWTPVPGAHSYEYVSYNDNSMHHVRAKQKVAGTSKTVAKVADGTFWWRVRAVDAQRKTGPWSSLRQVTTDTEPPSINPLETIGDMPVQGTVRFVFESVDEHPYRITSGVFSEVPPNGMPTGSELDQEQESVAEAVDVNVRAKVTLNINTLTMPNGRETIIVNVEDRAGNVREERFYFTVANPSTTPENPPAEPTNPATPKLTQTVQKAASTTSKAKTRTNLQINTRDDSEGLPATNAGRVLGVSTRPENAKQTASKKVANDQPEIADYWYLGGSLVVLTAVLAGVKLAQRRGTTT